MRRVLNDRHEVAHLFASRSQSEGRAGNMFFENGILFSYGRHFAIAKWIGNNTVAMTTQRYSPSTQRHISIARNALNHVKRVYCYDPMASASENKEHAEQSVEFYIDESTKPRIRQSTRDSLKASALNKALEFNTYLEALIPADRGTVTPIATDNLDQFAAVRAQQLLEARIRAEAHKAKQAQDAVDLLIEWRNGGDVDIYRLRNLPVALRLGNSRGTHNTGGLLPDRGSEGKPVIETSYGAQIPREDAIKVWTVVLACKEQDRPLVLNVGVPLGNYRLNRIDANGDIHVGCHHIQYSELALMAEKLGYNVPVEA